MMRPHPAEVILFMLLIVGALLHLVTRPDYSKRHYEFMPNMTETPGYESQDANPNFGDGKTLRTPAEGTVARGFLPLNNNGELLNQDTPWEKMSKADLKHWDAYPPSAPDDPSKLDADGQAAYLSRGREVFTNVCATCHGGGGTGGTAVVKRGMPAPTSLLDEAIVKMTDGHLFHVITHGKGNMAPHGNHVARADRWKVIRYVRGLQGVKE